jgi:ABC-type nitrate/sulfonate/bicarbonate transport system permease component
VTAAGQAGRGRAALGALGLTCMVALLEIAPRAGLVSPDYLPPASQIGRTLAAEATSAAFWIAVGHTLQAWAIGLAIAFAAAVAVGLAIDGVPRLRALTASTIEFLRPIPSVALVPLAVLLFGATIRSTLMLVVYASFWQVLLQVLAGAADVDPVARDTARSYRLGRWMRLTRVTWPAALPYVLTGLRLAASVALILAITAELVIGSPGLGREIASAQTSGAVDAVYALVVAAGLIGVAVNGLVRLFERRVLAWHSSVRGEVAR